MALSRSCGTTRRSGCSAPGIHRIRPVFAHFANPLASALDRTWGHRYFAIYEVRRTFALSAVFVYFVRGQVQEHMLRLEFGASPSSITLLLQVRCAEAPPAEAASAQSGACCLLLQLSVPHASAASARHAGGSRGPCEAGRRRRHRRRRAPPLEARARSSPWRSLLAHREPRSCTPPRETPPSPPTFGAPLPPSLLCPFPERASRTPAPTSSSSFTPTTSPSQTNARRVCLRPAPPAQFSSQPAPARLSPTARRRLPLTPARRRWSRPRRWRRKRALRSRSCSGRSGGNTPQGRSQVRSRARVPLIPPSVNRTRHGSLRAPPCLR